MSFEFQQRVRTQHCDPGGSVFYPRYFEMLTVCAEEWFAAVLGLSYSDMRDVRKIGTPTVSVGADFQAPSRVGDMLEWRVVPQRLGRTSCDLCYRVTCNGEARVELLQTIVLIDMESRRSLPWPDDLREKIEREFVTREGMA